MRKLLACALLLAAALPAQAASAGSGTGTLKGAVYDTSCGGPCASPPPPYPLYTGDNLVVKVRSLPDRVLVAKLHPTDGRFRIELSPGIYRVKARVNDGGDCWQGEAKRRQVFEGEVTRVRLHVYNACIV